MAAYLISQVAVGALLLAVTTALAWRYRVATDRAAQSVITASRLDAEQRLKEAHRVVSQYRLTRGDRLARRQTFL